MHTLLQIIVCQSSQNTKGYHTEKKWWVV